MMNEAIVGVDPSSRKLAAIITIDDQRPKIRIEHLPAKNPTEQCDRAYGWIRKIVRDLVHAGHEVHVFVEEPVLGRGGARATIPQTKVHGALLAGAKRAGATTVLGVNNSRWKKAVIGNGNASKPQIAEGIRTIWPLVYDMAQGDQDVLDAAGINRHGAQIVEMKERIQRNKKGDVRSKSWPRRSRSA